MKDLEELLVSWQNIEIVKQFIGILRKSWPLIKPTAVRYNYENPSELKEAFFSEDVYLGDTVILRGRISQYCPIYFPIAYSPQAIISSEHSDYFETIYNPAPTKFFQKTRQGDTLAFLFDKNNLETPRIISKYHPDRTSEIPFSLSDPAIPILIDSRSETLLENIVEVKATLIRIDDTISKTIESSDENVVKNYYHAFFDEHFIPAKGYMLDARSTSGGSIRSISEHSNFITSIAMEFGIKSKLNSGEIESILINELTNINPLNYSPFRYRPAFYTPGGYEIIQFSSNGIFIHYAPSLATMKFSTIIDTINIDREFVFKFFLPTTKSVIDGFKREDNAMELSTLFTSDDAFIKRTTT